MVGVRKLRFLFLFSSMIKSDESFEIVCLILLETNICVCSCMEYDKMKEEVNVLLLEKDTCIEEY